MNQLLSELKSHGLSALAEGYWYRTLDCIRNAGCANVIVACTDLSACLEKYPVEDLAFFDSGNLLAEHTIKRYMDLARIPDTNNDSRE